jgi:hypothetical protein
VRGLWGLLGRGREREKERTTSNNELMDGWKGCRGEKEAVLLIVGDVGCWERWQHSERERERGARMSGKRASLIKSLTLSSVRLTRGDN